VLTLWQDRKSSARLTSQGLGLSMYEPVVLGPRYNLRIEDLTVEDAVEVECLACGHRFPATPFRLRERFPADTRIVEVAKHLRCACGAHGNKDQLDWRIVRVVAPKFRTAAR